jgi:LytS/YehU family sensor histidine kinase
MYTITIKILFSKYYEIGKGYFFISFGVILFFSLFFCLADIYLLPDYKGDMHEKPPFIFLFMRYFMTMGLAFFIGTSVSLMEHFTRLKEKEKILIEEKLETELKLLKAQINPHFIFNALNNIYSLSYSESKNAPDSILKLSEMLRYVFYDCNKDRVPLSAELNYIENFNAFQQMKSKYAQNISLKMKKNLGNIEIAPMLFIPFLENAYKYSRIEENEDAYVNIRITEENDKIHFKIENSISQNAKSTPGSGIGINNVIHRLNIIYPGKHKLNIDEQNTYFCVDLVLEL